VTEVGPLSAAGWAWSTHTTVSASLLPTTGSMQAGLAAAVGLTTTGVTGCTALVVRLPPPHHNRLTALFPGTTWVNRCQKRTSGLYGPRED